MSENKVKTARKLVASYVEAERQKIVSATLDKIFDAPFKMRLVMAWNIARGRRKGTK